MILVSRKGWLRGLLRYVFSSMLTSIRVRGSGTFFWNILLVDGSSGLEDDACSTVTFVEIHAHAASHKHWLNVQALATHRS